MKGDARRRHVVGNGRDFRGCPSSDGGFGRFVKGPCVTIVGIAFREGADNAGNEAVDGARGRRIRLDGGDGDEA